MKIEDLKSAPNAEELIAKVNNGELTLQEAYVAGAEAIIQDENERNKKANAIADGINKHRRNSTRSKNETNLSSSLFDRLNHRDPVSTMVEFANKDRSRKHDI